MFYLCGYKNGLLCVMDSEDGAIDTFTKPELLNIVYKMKIPVLGVGEKLTFFKPSTGSFSEQASSYLIRKLTAIMMNVKQGTNLGLASQIYWLDETIFGFEEKEIYFHKVSCYITTDMLTIGLDIELKNASYLGMTEFINNITIANDNMIHIEVPTDDVLVCGEKSKALNKLFTYIDNNRKVFL